MEEPRQQQNENPQSGQEIVTDELTDQVSAEFTGDQSAASDLPGEQTEPVMLEEEKVKDEIDIQIDLLKDPDWVVRREAAITLGEMGDERCVEPLCKALYDGDWQVREVAVEALGQIGSPAVEMLVKMVRDWDVRKYVLMALGKIRDERVLDPLMLQLRSDEFKDDATNALVELGEPALERLVKAGSTDCPAIDQGAERQRRNGSQAGRIGTWADQAQWSRRPADRHAWRRRLVYPPHCRSGARGNR